MNVEQEFRRLADEWKKHCKRFGYSSNIETYLEHPSYEQIVALGPAVVPYIIELYRDNGDSSSEWFYVPWQFALQDITGVPMIPNRDYYVPSQVRKRWLEWWAEQQKSGMR